MASENLIVIENMSKSFQSTKVKTIAVNNANFELKRGDFIAITGASGSGKSTFMSLVALLEQADSGNYMLSGSDVSTLSFSQKSLVRNKYFGIIYQAFNLINEMTVYENVALPLKYNKDISRSEFEVLVLDALNKVGMDHRTYHMPYELSGGEKQRVAIARSLVNSPALILADEPTGNLDSKNSENIMMLLQKLNDQDKVSVILVTHDDSQAALANKKYRIVDGNLSEL
jgi:putative ABC transport system ATP-binding protein